MSLIKVAGLLLLLPVVLSACTDKAALRLGPQYWQEIQFVVETRPTPVQAGMNEFIVIATREQGKPGVGLIVELRIGEQSAWTQAIQDGYTGVYRRAIAVQDPQRDVLAVHVRPAKTAAGAATETTLYFPLLPPG
jgi:hypothetical protein